MANLSAGRVIVGVAKEGMVVATVQTALEAESRPPLLVLLSAKRVAVLLGAAEWLSPGSPPLRLERELPRLLGAIAAGPRLQQEQADDLQAIGLALLEPLREAAGRLHQRVQLERDEPLLEMLLVGYVEDYGPEVWVLRYRAIQEPLRGDYWQTRVLRPQYTQLYPPEKGQPRTLMEARYPPEDDSPLLLDLLRSSGPQMAGLSDKDTVEAAGKILAGESHKAGLDAAVTLLRATLHANLPAETTVAVGVIRERTGFEWILPPPEPPQRAEEEEEKRPAGAPTLKRKPPQ